MPNIITGHNDVLILLGAKNGGWCVYAGDPDNTASEILETAPAAAVSDDEGLIEWFAEQLSLPAPELQARPPNPGPVAKPAEHCAPPVGDDQVKHLVDRFLSWRLPENFNPDGGISFRGVFNEGTDAEFRSTPSGTNLFDAAQAEAMVRHMLAGLPAAPDAPPVAAPTPGAFEDALLVSQIRDALEPFATFARQVRGERSSYFAIRVLEGEEGYAEVSMGDLHNLLSAADMFTDEMQAPAPATGPATAAEDQPPSPSSAAPDAALADRVDMVDVGDGDDDGVDF